MSRMASRPQGARPEDNLPPTAFGRTFAEHIKAGYQCLYIQTSEEHRVEAEIQHIVRTQLGGSVVIWDEFEGFNCFDKAQNIQQGLMSPTKALELLVAENFPSLPRPSSHAAIPPTVVIFRDLDDYFAGPPVRRRIRSLAGGNMLVNATLSRPLVIISPRGEIHPKLRSHMAVIEYKLPEETELTAVFERLRSSVHRDDPARATVTEELRTAAVRGLRGLTSQEAENCVARCVVKHGGFKPEIMSTIKTEKASIIKKSEVLTYIPEENQVEAHSIGGYDAYLEWLAQRKLAYTPEAKALGIDFPRGVVIAGPPGCGKSLVGRATSRLLGIPGFIMDVGAVHNKFVGESEQRLRDALATITAQYNAMLFIDEADKMFGNASSDGGDSGVSRRVYGALLTWLTENRAPIFTIMTVNRPEVLDPEFLRAGRFDAVWSVDLPTDEERIKILQIHMSQRNVSPAAILGADGKPLTDADWNAIAETTKGFVGSELEEGLKEARFRSFDRRRSGDPTFEELIESFNSIVPMTKSNPDGIEKIRAFCKGMARPVNKPGQAVKVGRQSRKINLG